MGGALTADLPAIEGELRVEDEDFVVEEVLSYEPCGEGTHVFFRIEKRGLTSFEAIRRIARALGRKEGDVGCAGLKDKRAITRQSLSLEFASEEELRALEIPGIAVLEVARHKNKLKLGHLRGNRFEIRVRGVRDGDLARAQAKIALLERVGLPNSFGPQRFGRDGTTPLLGRALLREDAASFVRVFTGYEGDEAPTTDDEVPAAAKDSLVRRCLQAWRERGRPEHGMRALPKRFLSLCVSAVQSEVFNCVLERRVEGGQLASIVDGDVAFLHRNGACFAVAGDGEVREAAARAASFEISPSGPLPGPSCLRPGDAVGELEDEVLAGFGLTHEAFALRRPWAQKGARRALRVPLTSGSACSVRETRSGDVRCLELGFELPKGSFATALTGELFA